MDSVHGTWGLLMWVSPFRDPWINGYLLLPMAFRSLSRLSSALSAKASTLRSFLLNLFVSGCLFWLAACACTQPDNSKSGRSFAKQIAWSRPCVCECAAYNLCICRYSVTVTCLLLLLLRLFSFAVFLHLHEATQRLGCLFFLFVWSQYSVFKVHILLLTVLSVMKNRKISDFSSLVKTSYINIFIKMMFFIYKSLSALFLKKSGSHLLSHTVSSAVPSAA